MATNIFDYPYSSPTPSLTPMPPTQLTSPALPPSSMQNNSATAPVPAPAPAPNGAWSGHMKPAQVQIVVIVLIAGLFNAFFFILSLRLLWRRYHHPGPSSMSPAIDNTTSDNVPNLRRVTPMLVRQPDDKLVYGLKQVLADEPMKVP